MEDVVRYQLEGNSWILQVYEKKLFWDTTYLHDTIFSCIQITSLCEGVDSNIKTYVKRNNIAVVKL